MPARNYGTKNVCERESERAQGRKEGREQERGKIKEKKRTKHAEGKSKRENEREKERKGESQERGPQSYSNTLPDITCPQVTIFHQRFCRRFWVAKVFLHHVRASDAELATLSLHYYESA